MTLSLMESVTVVLELVEAVLNETLHFQNMIC